MMGEPLWIANAGTSHELTICQEGDLYWLDNTPEGRYSRKTWDELPRCYRSITGAKCAAAALFGEPQVWTVPLA